ncbi:MAG: DUF1735 domain-containing protein [Prevotella sp.]|nr:DUF1735 domain-containing protein [Prevotella sp.]
MKTTFRKIGAAAMSLLLAVGFTTSCSNGDWEDNLRDTIDRGGNNGKISVYFAMQAPIQPIILGNDDQSDNTDDNLHQFRLNATWGGSYKNNKDCRISYQINPALLEAGSGMEVLPTRYYTLEDATTLTIPAGKIIGGTVVKLTDEFFNDAKAATTHYVLPVELTASLTGDSIIKEKSTQLLCVKFINQYSGLYCKTGTTKVQGGTSITHKNEDALDRVSCTALNTSQVTYSYPVKEWKYDEEKKIWEEINVTKEVTLALTFAADGSCQILQDGKSIGTGSFTARGIQDFSDAQRMADCLKLKFTASIVTNAGDADHEKTWTVDADYVMSMMNRGVKLESWK